MLIRYFSLLVYVLMFSPLLYAQTSGPKQPEASSFQAVSANDLVNLFSGEFQYNIPLFELPGPNGSYPFNIFYSSGPSMSEEASWIGLGWNLSPGMIDRQMRNIPDDFNGADKIKHYKTMKDSWSVGGSFIMPAVELLGIKTGDMPGKSKSTVSFSVSYNNMTGIGLSIGANLDFNRSDRKGFYSNIGLSSGNLSGLDVKPTFGIRSITDGEDGVKKQNSFSAGLNLNSINGMQSLYLSHDRKTEKTKTDGNVTNVTEKTRTKGTSFNFSDKNFSPSLQREMVGGTIDLSLELGPEVAPGHFQQEFKGFYSVQKLKDKGEYVEFPAYGYNYLERAESGDGIADFIREGDKAVNPKVPLLPIPVTTYDIFSVKTQMYNTTFRPYRSEVGVLNEMDRSSLLTDMNLGLEIGLPSPDFKGAADITILGSYTVNNDLKIANAATFPQFKSRENLSGKTYREPYYFKSFGDSEVMAPEEFQNRFDNGTPGFIPITGNFLTGFNILSKINVKNSGQKDFINTRKTLEKRAPRTQMIQNFSNAELKSSDGILKYFDFKYYDVSHLNQEQIASASLSLVDNASYRSSLPQHHIGGFEVVGNDGTRYIFALPVYVNEQAEVTFNDFGCVGSRTNSGDCPYTIDIPKKGSDPNELTNIDVTASNKSLDVQIIPKYATTYLLTAILGTDYVDLNNDGITEDDLGYWVKFNYVRTSKDYKWKAPFYGANFLNGQESTSSDNMGAFTCGSREVWYLLSAETSTHLAEFSLSKRHDARGANHYLLNSGDANKLGAYSYKLDNIKLYSKLERITESNTYNTNAIPIQSVLFGYSTAKATDLCQGIHNAEGDRGKLTLLSLTQTYKDNSRGTLNPYRFSYTTPEIYLESGVQNYDNPDYNEHAMDRWGKFQTDKTGRNRHYFKPYTRQEDVNQHLYYNAWNLKTVQLPSGSLIDVVYEPKDYAYVQNRKATQMMKMTDYGKKNDKFYVEVDLPELPADIASSSCNTTCKESYIRSVFKDEEQLLFRLYVNLNESLEIPQNENVSAYVSYANPKIEINGDKLTIYVDHAFSNGLTNVHPFQNAVYNYIKNERLDLFTAPFVKPNEYDKISGVELLKAVAKLLTNVVQIYEVFLSVERQCHMKGFGRLFDIVENARPDVLANSYIRVPVLNGTKYGGGARVKNIYTYERPDRDPNGDVLGTVYDYRTTDQIEGENGKVYSVEISSGVAENEPNIGSDESAIIGYEKWLNSIALFSSISQFSQTPYNSSFYPGPTVGYSKVTQRTLASDKAMKRLYSEDLDVRTTGQIVNEFYTARDFPVLIDRTVLDKSNNSLNHNKFNLNFQMFNVSESHLIASQGFSIELNDMHGKAKKVSYYAQNKNGDIIPTPYSWQETHYKTAPQPYKAHGIPGTNKIQNLFSTVCSEGNIQNKLIGVNVDEFVDIRGVEIYTASTGVEINIDVTVKPIPLPLPSGLPSLAISHEKVGLCVNNKVITKAGIVDRVVAYDRGAYSVVKNEVFDELTTQAVLVSTVKSDNLQNIYNSIDKTYKYDIMGHWVYEGLDGAYKNALHEIIPNEYYPVITKIDRSNTGRNYIHIDLGEKAQDIIKGYYVGDELMMCSYTTQPNYNKMGLAVVVSTQENILIVEAVEGNFPLTTFEKPYIKVIRPGRRNNLGVNLGSIVSTTNPFINRTSTDCK